MACGGAVIAVNTTGHADIVTGENAIIIATKGETTVERDNVTVACWPEPDLDDTIAKLEWSYQNRTKLKALGFRASVDLAQMTWRKTAEELQRVIRRVSR